MSHANYGSSSPSYTPPKPDDVGGQSIAYQMMSARWTLIQDLLGGTLTMRGASSRWLPPEEKERGDHYMIRLNRSILHAGLENAIDSISAKPFSETVKTRGDNLPEWIQEILDDPDGTGRGITEYASELFRDGLTYGHSVQWIDAEQTGGTLDPLEELGVAPYCSIFSPPAIYGWRSSVADGEEIVTQLRVYSTRCEEDGAYGEKVEDILTLYLPGSFEVFSRPAGHEPTSETWKSVSSGKISYPEKFGLPVVPFYVKRSGILMSDPPFEELAWANLAHWQSDSDQRNILRFSRVGTFVAAGLTDEEREAGIDRGPRNQILSTNPELHAYYVEPTGTAIAAGERDLERLEERMRQLGMKPMTVGSVERTAMEVSTDESRSLAAVQSWIRRLEQALRQAVVVAGRWRGEAFVVPDDFEFDVFSDFIVSDRSSQDMEFLDKLNARGKLQDRTLLDEAKRRGILAEAVDVDDEVEAIERAGPPLGLMTADQFGAMAPNGENGVPPPRPPMIPGTLQEAR